jgi:hypothetical protein
MQAVAHNPAFAKKAGVPQSVGKEFTKPKGNTMPISLKKKTQSEELDEKKKEAISDSMGMKKGGMAMKKNAGFMAMIKKKAGDKPAKKMAMGGYKDGGMPMKKMANGGMTSMGAVKTAAPSRDGIAAKGKTKGTQIKMAGNSNDLRGGTSKMTKMNKGGRAC